MPRRKEGLRHEGVEVDPRGLDRLIVPRRSGVCGRPDARGTGASGKLIQAAIEGARLKGALRVALWVNGVNAHARGLYERMGFQQTGRIPGGIKVADMFVDDVLMSLELT